VFSIFGSLFRTLWQFKWWWIPPVGLMVLLFVALIVFSNATGDSPFQYIIF
jgi:hypothetical protein